MYKIILAVTISILLNGCAPGNGYNSSYSTPYNYNYNPNPYNYNYTINPNTFDGESNKKSLYRVTPSYGDTLRLRQVR